MRAYLCMTLPFKAQQLCISGVKSLLFRSDWLQVNKVPCNIAQQMLMLQAYKETLRVHQPGVALLYSRLNCSNLQVMAFLTLGQRVRQVQTNMLLLAMPQALGLTAWAHFKLPCLLECPWHTVVRSDKAVAGCLSVMNIPAVQVSHSLATIVRKLLK